MRVGIIGDIHWSQYSSILRQRGDKYSKRLENCIASINWAEQLTLSRHCDEVVYLGDFFDKSQINYEEITALKEITWNDIHHSFLVGNHEMGAHNLAFSSSHIFNMCNADVIDIPMSKTMGDCTFHFLPYILESDRKPINDYITKTDYKNIIFSHNDISGIQLGSFLSKNGFSIDEIEANCDLFLNGHLHNGSKVTDKIINVGNLTGQNFSEDGFKYEHTILILDTNTMRMEVWVNPYAISFYKLDNVNDLYKIKTSAVVTVKALESEVNLANDIISKFSYILAYRIITVSADESYDPHQSLHTFEINHIDKFREFVLTTLGNSDLVVRELDEVLSG